MSELKLTLRTIIFAGLLFLFSLQSYSQTVSCNELLEYVLDEGSEIGKINPVQLYKSGWLESVEAYSISNSIAIIAEIKKDDYGFNTKKYIFCNVPQANWDAFYFGLYDKGKTYGERFHKYIIDYTCDCDG
jgi:hypothetical protein